ncbi:MAG: hypothetical protein B9S34_06575 [Opitutia bacterium Tous-C1TDCM]|nr:MAG: hypothetical protein B9S34_06575 [Opitutae bacterium Tous-C1TDCM]
MPHGQCYLWSPWLIGLHGLSDALIALAYFSIPVALLHLARRRPDLPHRGLFLMLGAFIVACGLTHALEVWTIWHSHYLFSGSVKAATAVISVFTAVALFRALPEALQLVGPAQLQALNASLETRVQTRTGDLEAANLALRREVADREKAEAEVKRLNLLLQRRLDELRALFDMLPVGVGIAEDRDCKTIRTNDALARQLGLPRQANASLTAPPDEAPRNFEVHHAGRLLSPDELPMQVCARENRPVLNFREVVKRHDGTRLALLANAVPLHDSQGEVTGCVATFQDVTELENAVVTNARYAAIVASSVDAIIGKTLAGIITEWNAGAERIFGYTAAEIIGQPIGRIYPEHLRAEGTAILERVNRGEAIPTFETVRRHRDGRPIDISISLAPIRDAAGGIVGALESARDITERKQAEQHRREMERKIQETQKLESLGVLAGGIAHDFNNLLTGILGNASLARLELPASSPVIASLSQIETASRRAADLCRQMLAYSGRGRFIVQPLDLNQVVTETTHLLNLSIGKSSVLRFNLAPALPPVTADATQIRQIIMNLVINASEAIGSRSGVIAIGTGVTRIDHDYIATLRHHAGVAPGDFVFIEVSDTGCGMDAPTLDRIFDPFFTTKFTGRGLGLAAVLGIVRGHSGALKVYSEPGRGTTFRLLLPISPPEREAAAARFPAEPVPRELRSAGHVLVVDDEETVRTVAARMVEQMGFTAVLASDGREAVEKFRAAPSRYRLVVLDLTMPHLDGEETFRQLRQLAPGIRVILMSGFAEQEAVSRFTGKGLAGFVQKPFEVGALAAAIRAVALAG